MTCLKLIVLFVNLISGRDRARVRGYHRGEKRTTDNSYFKKLTVITSGFVLLAID